MPVLHAYPVQAVPLLQYLSLSCSSSCAQARQTVPCGMLLSLTVSGHCMQVLRVVQVKRNVVTST